MPLRTNVAKHVPSVHDQRKSDFTPISSTDLFHLVMCAGEVLPSFGEPNMFSAFMISVRLTPLPSRPLIFPGLLFPVAKCYLLLECRRRQQLRRRREEDTGNREVSLPPKPCCRYESQEKIRDRPWISLSSVSHWSVLLCCRKASSGPPSQYMPYGDALAVRLFSHACYGKGACKFPEAFSSLEAANTLPKI